MSNFLYIILFFKRGTTKNGRLLYLLHKFRVHQTLFLASKKCHTCATAWPKMLEFQKETILIFPPSFLALMVPSRKIYIGYKAYNFMKHRCGRSSCLDIVVWKLQGFLVLIYSFCKRISPYSNFARSELGKSYFKIASRLVVTCHTTHFFFRACDFQPGDVWPLFQFISVCFF